MSTTWEKMQHKNNYLSIHSWIYKHSWLQIIPPSTTHRKVIRNRSISETVDHTFREGQVFRRSHTVPFRCVLCTQLIFLGVSWSNSVRIGPSETMAIYLCFLRIFPPFSFSRLSVYFTTYCKQVRPRPIYEKIKKKLYTAFEDVVLRSSNKFIAALRSSGFFSHYTRE